NCLILSLRERFDLSLDDRPAQDVLMLLAGEFPHYPPIGHSRVLEIQPVLDSGLPHVRMLGFEVGNNGAFDASIACLAKNASMSEIRLDSEPSDESPRVQG